jgi:ribosomal protein S18 acetylase RimI-like enzyme
VRTEDLRSVMRLAWSQRSPPLPGVFFEQVAKQEPERFRVVRDTFSGDVVGFVLTARLPVQERSIFMLAVRPELVGIGLRRALLRQVEDSMRRDGEREFTIEVPVDAAPLLDFYKEQGFVLVGRTQGMSGEEFVLSAPLSA